MRASASIWDALAATLLFILNDRILVMLSLQSFSGLIRNIDPIVGVKRLFGADGITLYRLLFPKRLYKGYV
jgi:hypothetical protein